MRRVGLNLLAIHPRIGGGWNYVKNVISALAQSQPSCELVAFVSDASYSLIPPGARFVVQPVAISGANKYQRILYEHVWLDDLCRSAKVDCVHWFGNTLAAGFSIPSVVTIYDLKVFEDPSSYNWITRNYLQAGIRHSVRKAKKVLPISETTKQKLTKILEVPVEQMSVVRNPVGDMFLRKNERDTAEFRTKRGLPDKFWLYVAHYYPHKNHLRLLKAFSTIVKSGRATWPLVLCGLKRNLDKELRTWFAEDNAARLVKWLPSLDDEEMPLLYSAAEAMIFPSLYEGAGIPLVEALACGCPVAAADIDATREFGGGAVIHFNPWAVDAIARTMIQIYESEDLRRELRVRGMAVIQSYSRENIGADLLKTYESVMESA